MRLNLLVFSLILGTNLIIYGSDERMTLHEDSMFIVTSRPKFTPAPNIDFHLEVLNKMVDWVVTESAEVEGRDSIRYPQRFFTQKTNDGLYYYGGRVGLCYFEEKNDHLWSFTSNLHKLRSLTEEETVFWRKHGYPPESIFSITESEAYTKARRFLILVLNEYGIADEFEQFDSLRIQKTERDYVVYFSAKNKNNIIDPRQVYIRISPDTGEILRISVSSLMPPYDMNYRPKINKEQVMEIIYQYLEIVDQKLGKHVLRISNQPKSTRMVWWFFDQSGSRGGYTADYLLIDCETGLIRKSTFDRNHSGKTIEEIKAME